MGSLSRRHYFDHVYFRLPLKFLIRQDEHIVVRCVIWFLYFFLLLRIMKVVCHDCDRYLALGDEPLSIGTVRKDWSLMHMLW